MKSIYLMMCGLSLSGKTYLANMIVEKYPNLFFTLDTRSIHDYLNQFEIFKDDNSISGRSFNMRNDLTNKFQEDIIHVVTKNGFKILHDSCNRKREERVERFKLVKSINPETKTVLLFVNTNSDIVLGRAKKEDNALREANRKPVWEELIRKQMESFDVPNANEVDYFLEYNRENFKNILSDLGDILSK